MSQTSTPIGSLGGRPQGAEGATLSQRRLIGLGGLVAASSLTACLGDPTSDNPTGPAASRSTTTESATKITRADALANLEAGNASRPVRRPTRTRASRLVMPSPNISTRGR